MAAGAVDAILRALELHGLHWDGAVCYQSDRGERYREALDALCRQGLCYRCVCSRRQLRGERIYPGTCRQRRPPAHVQAALRIQAPDVEQSFNDRAQGRCAQRLAEAVGDFVVERRDGRAGYPLAVVVDDGDAGVTDVVRGADLLDNTPAQMFLMQRLGMPAPRYLHVPVVVGRSGAKLSKSTAASAISVDAPDRAAADVYAALDLLGQQPPAGGTAEELLRWAAGHWKPEALRSGSTVTRWISL